MLRNCPQWLMFDQAALSLGLVVVPLYTVDRPDNVAYIVNDADVKLV
jgi:long-chain acyl-CoA synthetase